MQTVLCLGPMFFGARVFNQHARPGRSPELLGQGTSRQFFRTKGEFGGLAKGLCLEHWATHLVQGNPV